MEKCVILNDAGRSINVGDKNEDKIISIDCIIERGTITERGTINIVNNYSSAEVSALLVGRRS